MKINKHSCNKQVVQVGYKLHNMTGTNLVWSLPIWPRVLVLCHPMLLLVTNSGIGHDDQLS
jgi:hypothetical protein